MMASKHYIKVRGVGNDTRRVPNLPEVHTAFNIFFKYHLAVKRQNTEEKKKHHRFALTSLSKKCSCIELLLAPFSAT